MIPGIIFTSISEFSIDIGHIRNGWMDIRLTGSGKHFEYRTSYATEPMDDLLRMMLRGITKNPKHEEGWPQVEQSCVVVHDLEGDLITWAFYFDGERMHITIWENADTFLIDDIYEQRFDPTTFEYYEFVHDVDVNQHILFAVEGPMIDFARHLKTVLEELSARERNVDEFKDWGYLYSEENFRLLREYVEGV